MRLPLASVTPDIAAGQRGGEFAQRPVEHRRRLVFREGLVGAALLGPLALDSGGAVGRGHGDRVVEQEGVGPIEAEAAGAGLAGAAEFKVASTPSVSIEAMFWRRPRIWAMAPEAVRVIAAQLNASPVPAQRPSRTSASIAWIAPLTLKWK
jgi:hypothetical protein